MEILSCFYSVLINNLIIKWNVGETKLDNWSEMNMECLPTQLAKLTCSKELPGYDLSTMFSML